MDVVRLDEGLWRWTAPHPAWTPESGGPSGWPQQVGCVYFEPEAGGVVLVDPLVPEDPVQAARFWRALDADVARRGGSVVVAVTNAWHGRSADAVRERYPGCRVLAHDDARGQVSATLTGSFAGRTADLPGGLRAHRIAPFDGGESVIELPGGAGLCFGDAVMGASGGARICPASWQGGETNLRAGVARLRDLLGLSFARLLVSHGDPVLQDARVALETALSQSG